MLGDRTSEAQGLPTSAETSLHRVAGGGNKGWLRAVRYSRCPLPCVLCDLLLSIEVR